MRRPANPGSNIQQLLLMLLFLRLLRLYISPGYSHQLSFIFQMLSGSRWTAWWTASCLKTGLVIAQPLTRSARSAHGYPQPVSWRQYRTWCTETGCFSWKLVNHIQSVYTNVCSTCWSPPSQLPKMQQRVSQASCMFAALGFVTHSSATGKILSS